MKRLLSLLLCLLLLTALPARAELPLVYPEETVIPVMRLTDDQRRLAELLYAPVLAGEETIELPEGTLYDDVGPAMQSLMLTYPELFHLGRTYTISYWQNEPDIAISVSPSYRMSAREADALRQQLYAAALEIIARDSTALGLHDALVDRVSYGGTTDMRHTAVGALLEGAATCEGYAQALTLLYRMAGIPCGMVTGTGLAYGAAAPESHAWTVVYLDGGCSLIDVTWNDQEGAGLNTRWYYGLSTWQMAADHTPDADMAAPECTDHISWHRSADSYAYTQEDVFRALQRVVERGETLNLRVMDAELYWQMVGDTGALLDAYNAWCPEGSAFYGRYSYFSCDAQMCFILMKTE